MGGKLLRVSTFISAATCILMLIINIPLLFTNNWFLRFAAFSMLRNASTLGFIGNIIFIVLTCYCLSGMSWNGARILSSGEGQGNALLYGGATLIIGAVSLIFAAVNHTFTLGDIIFLLLPISYLGGVLLK